MDLLNSPYLSIAIIAIYMILVVYIGTIAWRHFPQSDPESYLLARRGLSGWVSSLTIQATQISALTFLGFIGSMYTFGISFWQAIMGYLFMVPLLWIIFNARIWKLGRRFGQVTFGDMVAYYFGNNRWVAATIGFAMMLALIPYVQAQFAGLGYVIEIASGGIITFNVAIIISYLVMIFYVLMGGMRAVAYTDAFQGILILGGLIGGGLLMVLIGAGGFGNAFDNIITTEPRRVLVAELGPFGNWLYLFTWAVAVNLGWPLHPHMWNKQHIARHIEFTRYLPAIHMLQVWLIFIGAYFISIAGLNILPGLNPLQAQTVTVDAAIKVFPLAIVGIFAAGGLAAMMSTVAGQIHSVGTVFARDFLIKFIQHLPEERQVWWTRTVILAHGTISLMLVLSGETLLTTVGALAAGLGVQILPVGVAVLTNQRWVTASGVIASIISGIGISVVLGLGWFNGFINTLIANTCPPSGACSPGGIFYAFYALILNTVVLIGVSALTHDRPDPQVRAQYAQVGW